ncbi:MAG: nucleotidyltransferase domain-containing protein [Treponema sp.]|jgi:predicted nucleotidyltransferase|nr:nucleotidyltransferase domain-containing protein [Treponema sp.]
MPPTTQAELETIIVNTVPVEQIYLFGSHAYGTPHKDSDLDLYIVLKDEAQMRNIDAGKQIHIAIGRKQTMPVDILVNKKSRYQELIKDATLERKIAREGIKIYG